MLSTDLFQVIESVYPNGLPFWSLELGKAADQENDKENHKTTVDLGERFRNDFVNWVQALEKYVKIETLHG